MVQTIVILGAGWVGLPLAHKILKHTLPKMNGELKLILVSPNSHFYWNVAAVRGVIPGQIADDEMFLPIAKSFTQYDSKNFEFILGKAEELSAEKNSVTILTNDNVSREVTYDQLVIATGSSLHGEVPLKPVGKHEDTISALHSLQQKIKDAKSIVVAGAGPTGVEVAGELASAYGKSKDITLVVSKGRALEMPDILPSIGLGVERDLRKLGVKLIHNAKVEGTQTAQAGEKETPQTKLVLSNGSEITADLYLPLIGVQVNTSWLPRSLLDSAGNLLLDSRMRVQGVTNIWGIGDVGNIEVKQLTVTDAQIIHLSTTLDQIVTGNQTLIKDYKPSSKAMIFVSLGKKYATGQVGGWKLWDWIISYVKGRKLFLDTAEKYVGGKQLRHGSV